MPKGKFEFFEGQSLSSLWWEQGESVYVGQNGVISIIVSMECGQMAAVPWAIVLRNDGSAFKHNLALVSGVKLTLKEKKKYCICCEEITEENAHLHRNCGK